ncbi:LysR substrate-binding domain-containing protein [Variovorax sp. J22R133]|uniref:LysR substrate-binding domain-containing protein n=1 Tax=Variovorax brevis TaxID=3053503 RepID=UPI002576F534|nr:LysR substrate-binding domain-containing protein [Variovorax sp. J22R133]MDM0110908.1 LysR substrate-binding domain-containing protein [Variovorax sp. J22R133]
MELNPRQLDAFRKVMLTGSMTIAAERLQVSQPAVSRLIKDLEASLGIRLFRREGNRLIPGAEAQRLFREVDLFYRGIEQIEKVARDLKSVRIGNLRIASLSALALHVICECVNEFSSTHPEVVISLDVRNSLSVLELAAANQIDIGFVNQRDIEYPGVNVHPLQSLPAVCVLHRSHKLAGKEAMAIHDFEGESIVSLGQNNPLRVRLEMELDAAGIRYRRPVETTLAYSACNFVRGNLGIAVIDPFTARHFTDPDIVFRPIEPSIPFECSFVLPAHQPRSKVVEDFIDSVKGFFSSR